jgi:hypothetical protein
MLLWVSGIGLRIIILAVPLIRLIHDGLGLMETEVGIPAGLALGIADGVRRRKRCRRPRA